MNNPINNNQSKTKINDFDIKAKESFLSLSRLTGGLTRKAKGLSFAFILSGLLVLTACGPAVTTAGDSDSEADNTPMITAENNETADSDDSTTDTQNQNGGRDQDADTDDTASPSDAAEIGDDNSETSADDSFDFDQTATGVYQQILPADAKAWLDSDNPPLLLDVRTHEENLAVRIPRSFLIPIDELERRLEDIPVDKDEPIIIYCRSGNRSAVAAGILLEAGFTNVYDLGGIMAWPYQTTFG